MFLTGSFAVLIRAAPPRFRPPAGGFAGELPRRRRRRKRFGLIQVFWCGFTTTLETILPKIPEKSNSLRPAAVPPSGTASQNILLYNF